MRSAKEFVDQLSNHIEEAEKGKLKKFFKGDDGETEALGVRFGTVFKLAKEFKDLSLEEISVLLDSKYYEIRMGAVSIMDFQARDKKFPDEHKKALFDLYLNRHDRLNNWDLVDRGAYNIIGEYLMDKPREILYELARSKNLWKRRTAIVSTYAFIKKNQLFDTFQLAEILVNDDQELINKAVGSWIREAGKRDEELLCNFLENHAATMPRVTLRYAVEKLDDSKKHYFMNLNEH